MAFAAEKIDPLLPAIEPPDVAAVSGRAQRLLSLDVFRGLTIAGMILVNNPGNWDHVYAPLTHAEWNGWTFADLIFPFFLFIVGVAITLALAGATRDVRLLWRIMRRTILLFALGLFLNWFSNFDSLASLRIPGVLQRIALCYFAASMIFLTTGAKGQSLVAAALLAGYWVLLAAGSSAAHAGAVIDPEANVTAVVDRNLLGEQHLFHSTWDPEGLLSTLPAIATTLFGVLAGRWLKTNYALARKTRVLLIAGIVGAGIGALLGLWLPINKNLWTSSFAIFTAGLAAALFGACTWLVDVKGIRRPLLPFVVFGVNPIAVYLLSMMVGSLIDQLTIGDAGDNLRVWICDSFFAWWAGPWNGSLLFAIGYVLFWLAAMTLLYRRQILIKI